MTHEQLKAALPAYIARRLEEAQMRQLEEHFEVCSECREMAASWQEWAVTLREEGDSLFEPHPEPDQVRLFAQGALAGEASAQVRRHLEVCASCELEAMVWSSHAAAAAVRPFPPAAPRGKLSRWVGLSAAAGLVAGLGLGWLLLTPSAAPGTWAGPTAQIVLRTMLRNGDRGQIVHTIQDDEHRVVVSFPPVDSGFQDRDGSYRFEISGAKGVVLTQTMTGGKASRHAETAGVVTFDLPSDRLPPGRYQCRVTGPDGTVLYHVYMDIAGR